MVQVNEKYISLIEMYRVFDCEEKRSLASFKTLHDASSYKVDFKSWERDLIIQKQYIYKIRCRKCKENLTHRKEQNRCLCCCRCGDYQCRPEEIHSWKECKDIFIANE